MSEPRVIHTGVDFGEGPRWRDGRLWFSDFHRHAVFSIGAEGGDERIELQLDGEQPSGLGWLPDGTMLVVAMLSRKLLAVSPDGVVNEYADLSDIATANCNDLVVSADGHAYVGNFGFDLDNHAEFAVAYLAHVTPEGEVRRVDHPLAFPNGSVISPDGSTLIVGETFGGRYTAFTLDESGHPVDPRTWASIEGHLMVAASMLTVRFGFRISSVSASSGSTRTERSAARSRSTAPPSRACSVEPMNRPCSASSRRVQERTRRLGAV